MHSKNELKKNWDEERFTKIFYSYYEAVYRYMLYRVIKMEPAQKLSVLVFERVLKNLEVYQQGQPAFESWLFTTAGEVCNNWLKMQKRKKRMFWEKWFFQGEKETLPAQPVDEHTQARLKLAEGFGTLTPRERELLALKFGALLNNRTIAEQTGFNEQHISESLKHILKKLNQVEVENV